MKKGFENIKHWIFDLDNTLLDSNSTTYPELSKKIADFTSDFLNVSREEALKIQKDLHFKYGVTIKGLIEDYGLKDAKRFFVETHDLDFSVVPDDKKLLDAISKLPGDKYVLTVSPKAEYADIILRKMGLDKLFKCVWGIEETDLISKPHPEAYLKLMNKYNMKPEETIMIEDSYKSVVGAKELGLKTIWLKRERTNFLHECKEEDMQEEYADIITDDLAKTLKEIV